MSAQHAGERSHARLDLISGPGRGEQLLDGLDPIQRQAITHRGRRLIVRGAAGTGKTRVIETRLRWLIGDGAAPERIGLVVPTAARAAASRERLETALSIAYEELHVLTPSQLAALVLSPVASGADPLPVELSAGDRLAMLVERIDELSLAHHDFGGRRNSLLGSFVRRIDRLKAELITPEEYLRWAQSLPADSAQGSREREFADIYRTHERMLSESGARDAGDLVSHAISLARRQPTLARRFDHLLVDDAQELDLAPAALALEVGEPGMTVAGDPWGGVRRFRGAGAVRLAGFEGPDAEVLELARSRRCPERVWRAATAALTPGGDTEAFDGLTAAAGGEVELWRCANERSQAQAVAVDIERLVTRDGVAAGRIAVLVADVTHEGQAVGVALDERAVAHRLVGEAVFFQRAEIRDVLAWLRLLADPTDAAAVVRALARPPIELRSVDIARCTQIARRRKLDMVAALAAATESPQVPPEARERVRVFLKLYRSGLSTIDTIRPDLYVHRLIDRLGLRRQQFFAAQPDVVERLRALADFGELAATFVRRAPQATPREFARSVAAVADFGLREQEEPDLTRPAAVQILSLAAAGGLEVDHVYAIGLHAGLTAPVPEAIPDALLRETLPADSEANHQLALHQTMYVALSRARRRLVLAYPRSDDRGGTHRPGPTLEAVAVQLGAVWVEKEEELFGPAEALHSTYRLMCDELLAGTARAGGRLSELRFDTDLDVTHAVVRYLELLKLAALIARPEGQSVAESLRDVNSRILQAVTSEQREIFSSSALDDYLLDAERDARRRAQAVVARDEPSLEPFLPRRGEGVVLSASDIDTYRTCPLKYKFARVFRIPQEPTLHQRFGILVHQVLERFHARDASTLPELLGLLDAGWRRGGFGDSEEERQLRGKASSALTRYLERFQSEDTEPVWFERSFQFKLGRHMLRGRVDRVDRLPGGEYELIDYKTGRPKRADQLADDVQLSLYAVGAREAWQLDASRQAYYYLLDDQKVAVPSAVADRSDWITEVATEVAEGIQSQGFEPTPSYGVCSLCDYRLVCPAAER
ncbi:MAG: ATP-dependent helicase [Actinomycetota bacterium]|nr:ATP-dependent helicase [Actinomycetota bacterium]